MLTKQKGIKSGMRYYTKLHKLLACSKKFIILVSTVVFIFQHLTN